jgi:hypothetical protein
MTNRKDYDTNSVRYCVNHKGHKIPPYHTESVSEPKRLNWNMILSGTIIVLVFGAVMSVLIVALISNI